MGSSLPESDRGLEFTGPRIPEKTPPEVIIQKMAMPDSGLDIRNRVWLKMTIPNAFTGESSIVRRYPYYIYKYKSYLRV